MEVEEESEGEYFEFRQFKKKIIPTYIQIHIYIYYICMCV